MQNQKMGVITEIERYAVKDGPGIRTVVFLKGCPLRCRWCANPETQASAVQLMYGNKRCIGCKECIKTCPRGALSWSSEGVVIDRERCALCGACVKRCNSEALTMAGMKRTVRELEEEILKDAPFYRQSGGGVTFSGGEATAQGGFLLALLQMVRGHGIHTAIETCGYAKWEIYEKILPYMDLFFFDLKLMDEKAHIRYTGRSNRLILENFRRLIQSGANVFVRIPVIPGVNDTEENIRETVRFLRETAPGCRVGLLPYHSLGKSKYKKLKMEYELEDLESPPDEEMEQIRQYFEAEGFQVTIGE